MADGFSRDLVKMYTVEWWSLSGALINQSVCTRFCRLLWVLAFEDIQHRSLLSIDVNLGLNRVYSSVGCLREHPKLSAHVAKQHQLHEASYNAFFGASFDTYIAAEAEAGLNGTALPHKLIDVSGLPHRQATF